MNTLSSTSIINQLPGAIGYKNLESVYLGGNQLLAKCMGYDHPNDIVGLLDTDIKGEMCELAEHYVQQDKIVLSQDKQQHLDIGHYPNGELRIHMSTKKKLYDDNNQVIGTLFHCMKLQSSIINVLYHPIIKLNGPGFYIIGGQYKSYQLKKRESQCLFYLIRGYTAKEIAAKLYLSPKTIEYHIEQLKEKLHCKKRYELIEKEIHLGFNFHIPLDIFKN